MFVIIAVGGIDTAMVQVAAQNASNLDMFKNLDFIAIISLMAWGLGLRQPHILARFMAADSHHSMANARRISMTWMVLCLRWRRGHRLLRSGLFSTFTEQAAGVTGNPERVFIELSKILFNPWIAGVLLSAILAAVMTLSCQLLVCSSAITEDLTSRSCARTPPSRSWCGSAVPWCW